MFSQMEGAELWCLSEMLCANHNLGIWEKVAAVSSPDREKKTAKKIGSLDAT